jgi:hypothetical protein
MIRKWLAIGIILLFVGIAVAPTINFNTVKASTDDDLLEVTTQACGIKGYGDTTVKLTREQYQNLEEYLVEFRARLNQTSTRGEAVPIFKDAVVELDKYGLLPKGMSVERAQMLIIGRYQNIRMMKFVGKINSKNQQHMEGSITNSNCLIFGGTTNTVIISNLLPRIKIFQYILSPLIPIKLSGTIIFGYKIWWVQIDRTDYCEANGFLHSIGLITPITTASWTGDSGRGRIDTLYTRGFEKDCDLFVGATGFIGIHFNINGVSYYLGYADKVSISDW